MRQGQGCPYSQHCHRQFKASIELDRAMQPVGPAPEHQAAQGQPGEKCTDTSGDGIHLNPHHQ
ncbi:hypothetical protein D3C73_1267630 [compost metagenome]